MHIKQIIIQGFKSYKDQGRLERTFSKEHNVIVGRNGSGKTNFFDAILFVLSEKYSKLREEERQQLLHEGTGRGVMVAYVEIIFDNSDSRLPIVKDEVKIRRTIGLKKDEYRINNRTVTQREVINLLESAGFSSSNPYYVVEQGKVSRLTTMKDSDRLELLKEVAGTKVYDEKLAESQKILSTTNAKKGKIKDVIEYIKERTKELEEEKKKLKKFQKLDKRRRCVEYTIYNAERMDARDGIEELEETRENLFMKSEDSHKERVNSMQLLKQFEKEYNQLKIEVSEKKKEEELKNSEKLDIQSSKTKLELEIKDEDKEAEKNEERRNELQKELKNLQRRIAKVNKELNNKLIPKQKGKQEEIMKIQEEIAKFERRQRELFVKQGESKNFLSRNERDNWIKEQIKMLKEKIAGLQKSRNVKNNEREKAEKNIKNLEKKIKSTKKGIKDDEKAQKDNLKQLKRLKEKRDELMEDKKITWKKLDDLEKDFGKIKNSLSKKEKELESTFHRTLVQGRKSVKKIANERNIKGVWGSVIENFKCQPQFRKAIEAVGGSSLYHVIVESEDVAANLIEILNNNSQTFPGRITFIPLKELSYLKRPRTIDDKSKSFPLLQTLSYQPKLEPAFIHIFGRTYCCKSMQACRKFGNDHNVDTVTMEGDKVSKKGFLTGGFIDPLVSRIEIMDSISEMKNSEKSKKVEDGNLRHHLEKNINVQLNDVSGDLDQVEPRLRNLENELLDKKSQVRSFQNKLMRTMRSVKIIEQDIQNFDMKLKQDNLLIESYSRELRSEFKIDGTNLTNQEVAELSKINTEQLPNLKKRLLKVEQELKISVDLKITDLQNKLSSNFLIKEEEIQSELDNLKIFFDKGHELDSRKKELNKLEEGVVEIDKEIEILKDFLEENNKTLNKKQKEIEKLRKREDLRSKKLARSGNELEKLLNKKKILALKENDAISKIRELGTIPSNASKYEDREKKSLIEELHKIKEKIKRDYSHVNKKAVDQYEEFTNQRDDFIARKEELDKGALSIKRLIKTLDRKKDEAIRRTLQQIGVQFKNKFESIVDGGTGTITVKSGGGGKKKAAKKKKNMEDEEEEGESENEEESEEDLEVIEGGDVSVDDMTGLEIKMKFTEGGEYQIMSQLSGGQKTIVALALIFAIQEVDPGPFYLFDEIDSALDSQYRTAVAKMIKEQASANEDDGKKEVQYITTTFKNELVDVANQCFKIVFKNKVSRIVPITKNQAKIVLKEQEKQIVRRKSRKREEKEKMLDEEDDDDQDDDDSDGDN